MLMDDRYRAGLREVARRGLTYDVWLYHPQLTELADTIDAVPELTFIVNHLGGPVPDEATSDARAAVFDDWRHLLKEVARRPNVIGLFSGRHDPGKEHLLSRGPSVILSGQTNH